MVYLVRKAQKGNADAFCQLMELQKQSMLKVAKGFFRDEQDVADAIQDSILAAYEHLDELKTPAYFKTWLIRIVINHCNSMIRDKKHYELTEQIEDNYSPDKNQQEVEFRQMLDCLSEEDRLIFILYYSENLGVKEIANLLELKEGTVKSRLKRGRNKLSESLQNVSREVSV